MKPSWSKLCHQCCLCLNKINSIALLPSFLSCTYRPVHRRYTARSRFNRQILAVENLRGENILPVTVCPPVNFIWISTVLHTGLRKAVQYEAKLFPMTYIRQHNYSIIYTCNIYANYEYTIFIQVYSLSVLWWWCVLEGKISSKMLSTSALIILWSDVSDSHEDGIN